MIEKKLELIKEKIGKRETEKILDLIINVKLDIDNEMIKEIKSLISAEFNVSEKYFTKDNNFDARRLKKLFVWLLSEHTDIKNKEIAFLIKTSERNIYRYKKEISDILSISEENAIYKQYADFISAVKNIEKNINNFKIKLLQKWKVELQTL